MRNEIIIDKMLGYASRVIGYCADCTFESFSADTKTVEACVFNLSQIGELCHMADETFTAAHPEIPWHEMYGLRNRIVHDYDGVNLLLVWQIIREDLPELIKLLQAV